MTPCEIDFLGLKIHPWSRRETIDLIESNIIERKHNFQHIVVNAAKIVYAQKNELLRNSINNSDIVNIDGMAVVWALRLLGYNVPERVSGIDLFQNLLDLASGKGYKVFFLGAKPDVIQRMVNNLIKRYNNLHIVGFHHGYFSEKEEKEIVLKIVKSHPDMLFLGITSPKKEIFLNRYTNKMNVPFSMGVGGSFDILSGITKRAPFWMQNIGLEWLYRIYQEPRRMWKRYLVTNTIFIYLVFKALLTGNKTKSL
jgi:N-acetylglucosaminyldiphosphoundecaprenol N-acetyl-beta-D-mannosaminyltransferase